MKELPPLDGLSYAERDALIRGLWQELQTLRSEVEKLKQKQVKKTPRNSSLPPSKGFKLNQSTAQPIPVNDQETGSHQRSGRELSQQPDQIVVARANCPHCGVAVDLKLGAELFAQVRSLVNPAKRQGISAFDAIFPCPYLTTDRLATGLSNYEN